LDFRPYLNPLGLPKLAIGKDFFVVSKVDVLSSSSKAPPGTVTTIGENFLRVSTLDREVVLRTELTIDGEPIAISDLARRLELREGRVLRDLVVGGSKISTFGQR
jgi:hypothetical protein